MNTEDYKNPDGSIVQIYREEGVEIGSNVTLGEYVTLKDRATIKANSVIKNCCYIGANSEIGQYCKIDGGCIIGKNTTIANNVKLGEYCDIGHGCHIYPNVVIDPWVKIGVNIEIAKFSKVSEDYYLDGYTSEYAWCAHKNKKTGKVTFTFGCETHPLSYWTYNNTMKLLKKHNFNHKNQVLKVRRAVIAYFKE